MEISREFSGTTIMFGEALRVFDIVETIGAFTLAAALAIATRHAVGIHFALAARHEGDHGEHAGHEGRCDRESAHPPLRRLLHVRTNH